MIMRFSPLILVFIYQTGIEVDESFLLQLSWSLESNHNLKFVENTNYSGI